MMRQAGYDWIYNLHDEKIIDTIPKFELMVENLKKEPERYRIMNPANGWGDYDSLVELWEKEILPEIKQVVEFDTEATWWEWS